ncbi:MAG: hypothetical protein C0608_00215 [Deltaproteobacteria bacterium]|nr:MAG: hypothetical protein C0608_00215 [Deltaproteobacteria bacterium]
MRLSAQVMHRRITMNKFFKIALQILLPVIAIGIAVYGAQKIISSKKAPPKVERSFKGPLVRYKTVSPEDLQVTIEAYGTVAPTETLEVTMQVPGRVTELSKNLVSGGFIEEGELLLRVDARDYELAVEKARAEVAKTTYELSKAEEERALAIKEWELMASRSKLKMERPADDSLVFHGPQLNLAKANLASAEAKLAEAELNLSRTWVVAPFNARVLSESLSLGQYVTVGKTLATLYSTAAAEVVLPVLDSEMKWLGRFGLTHEAGDGPPVRLTSISNDTLSWGGRIVRTEGMIDEKDRTVNLVVEVKNPYERGKAPLVAGTFVKGEISGMKLKDIYEVPRSVLHENNYLWVIEDTNLTFRKVDIVRLTPESAWISGGLKDGYKVITTRLAAATDGMVVRAEAEEGVEK